MLLLKFPRLRIRNFVEGIEVKGDEATLTYTVPMPSDRAKSESVLVLDLSSPAHLARQTGFGPQHAGPGKPPSPLSTRVHFGLNILLRCPAALSSPHSVIAESLFTYPDLL